MKEHIFGRFPLLRSIRGSYNLPRLPASFHGECPCFAGEILTLLHRDLMLYSSHHPVTGDGWVVKINPRNFPQIIYLLFFIIYHHSIIPYHNTIVYYISYPYHHSIIPSIIIETSCFSGVKLKVYPSIFINQPMGKGHLCREPPVRLSALLYSYPVVSLVS